MTMASRTAYLFKRELWEHKGGVVWAPLGIAAAAILVIGLSLALGVDDFSRHIDQLMELSGERAGETDEPTRRIDFSRGEVLPAEGDLDWVLWGSEFMEFFQPTLHGIAIAFELLAIIVAFFYLLGGLYNDRKDRTVLFWKSLPFSETESVLVKLVFASLIIPLVALLAAFIVQLFFTGAALTLLLRTTNFALPQLLADMDVLKVFGIHLTLVLVFAVKNLPFYSWLLFSSAVSRKSPFLTAILPPLVIASLEGLIFNTSHFTDFIASFTSVPFDADGMQGQSPIRALLAISPLQALKIALVSVPLTGAAIWLRNHRFEI